MDPVELCEPLRNVLKNCDDECDLTFTVVPAEENRSCLSIVFKKNSAENEPDNADSSDSSDESSDGAEAQPSSPSNKLMRHAPRKKIIFKLATSDTEIDNVTDSKPGRYRLGYTKRQRKLLNDMSVPVQSKYALKVMKQMGWDGGSLGPRGDGITAPIIPQLNYLSGVGLGHPLPLHILPESPKKSKYKIDRLNQIMHVLTRNVEKIIKYDKQIDKKELNFVTHALTALNKRESINLSTYEEKVLISKVLNELHLMRYARCVGFVSGDMMQLKIKKITSQYTYDTKLSKSMIKTIANTIVSDEHSHSKITNEFYKKTLDQLILPFGPSFYTKDSINEITFKTTILVEIMQFAKSYSFERSLRFNTVLTRSERFFVMKVVLNLNKRTEFTKESFIRMLYVATQECVGKMFLDVVNSCNDYTIVLRKINKVLFVANEKEISEYENEKAEIFSNRVVTYDPMFRETDTNEDLKVFNLPANDKTLSPLKTNVNKYSSDDSDESPIPITRKKSKNQKYKKVLLGPKKYPKKIVNNDFMVTLQSILSSKPTKLGEKGLKCHGIYKGGVVMSCDSANCAWLTEMCNNNHIKVLSVNRVSTDDRIKMSVKVHVDDINDLEVDCSCELLNNLTSHNKGLSTNRWSVVGREQSEEFNYVLLKIEIDVKSFNFLLNSGFVLNAGNSKYEFSYLCEKK